MHQKRTGYIVLLLALAISIVVAATAQPGSTPTNDPRLITLAQDELVLESWMTDPTYLDHVVAESPQVVEPWMTDPCYMNKIFDDSTLDLEPWMSDPTYLDHTVGEMPQDIESWMTDPNYMADVIIEDETQVMEGWMAQKEYLQ